jgi:hypothetical protein
MSAHVRLRARPAHFAATLAFLLASLATLGFPGCADDLSAPGVDNPSAMRMVNLWPNDDQRFWYYAARVASLAYEPASMLPPGVTPRGVTVEDARRLLRDSVTFVGDVAHVGYGLAFDGEITTQSGVSAQNLIELQSYPGAGGANAQGVLDFRSRLLARVAAARTDLRERISALQPWLTAAAPDRSERRGWPLLIHGYAFRKTSTFIGTYGDVDTLLAWKFLDSDIHTGAEFEHQLVPSLASDVWLRALVDRRVEVTLPDGRVVIGLDVIYVIDYGVSQATDPSGNVTGTYRQFDYGRVTYVPGVGPVKDWERQVAYATDGLTHGYYDARLDLVETGVHMIRAPRLAAR